MTDRGEDEGQKASGPADEPSSEPPASGGDGDEGGPVSSAQPRASTAPPAGASPPPPPPPSYVFLGATSLVALVADLATKEWAVARLSGPGRPSIVVVEGVNVLGYVFGLHFDLAKNQGGAWGVLGDQPAFVRLPFFFAISAIAVYVIISLYRKLEPRQWALRWAMPLVLGGAVGNLVDRVRQQYVVDFIDVFMIDEGSASHWPTFNVADIWIVAGVVLMMIDWFTPRRATSARRPERAVRAAAPDESA